MKDSSSLLQRLENFQIDSPEASFSFSDRLARENNWSHEYTRQVIVEYKRFAYLAVAAGHPVSPPEDVDQVWHLHLSYSENYWKIFCPKILGQPLHHMPSQGGRTDREKFEGWYEQTCASYEKHFGQQPPADIWPSGEQKRAARHKFTRVDRSRHWVIPKPKFTFRAKALLALASVPLFLFCTGATSGTGANVFDWSGPDFLFFYFSTSTIVVLVAVLLRYHLRRPHAPQPLSIPPLDPYAIAYLNGGKGLTVDAALANLIRQNAVHLDSKKRILTANMVPEFAHEIEHRVYTAIQSKGSELKDVRLSAKPAVEKVVEHLQSLGLLMSRSITWKATILPFGVIVAMIAIGLVKIGIGLSRGKPVLFLVLICLIIAIGTVIGLARRTARSRYGDAVLAQIQDEHQAQAKLGRQTASLPTAEFVMILGLFGMSALAGTDLDHLRKPLATPGSDGGSVDGSGCGGGCGGGGCGGCGGS